jgi:tyrosyl-tRNA synthetase
MESNVFAELKWRGLVEQHTPEMEQVLGREHVTLYCGFDPTARSLHVGSLRPIIGLAWFQRYGHRPIALVGGGTGRIGDPSGKTVERRLLSLEDIARNVHGIRQQLERFLDFASGPSSALLLDNAQWLAPWCLTDFLRDIGKHFRIGQMLAKESVRMRMSENEGEGMSFTEFSYMLLQAADYLHLCREYGCTLQIGGSDQWGNITAGIELVRRLEGKSAHALTFPLVTTAAGVKFGKSESGAVWLDPELTAPYDFYQFWIRTDDRDVVMFLKSMTFLEHAEIEELARCHAETPGKRTAHARLAYEMTRMVHGQGEADRAHEAAQRLFARGGAAPEDGTAPLLDLPLTDAPSTQVPRTAIQAGIPLVDLLVDCHLAKSKGEARRLIVQGGAYVNEERVTEANRLVSSSEVRADRVLLRAGKRNYHVVLIIP